ncbi:DUF2207 domain-containing protein [Luteimicrobium subarcticum]|uniref:Putative membrane protein DUF2207 n=1 Tax=Luteimicrobium subarcticum TaxID=620910 RepID=A0A2M8WSF9_9MICO|nr:DUF2207 domain-containing protein [Luteimicrobium subarcticum]PJI93882.1 putative membrane protein DUF2207 [Luteimicrobium subarcticum]
MPATPLRLVRPTLLVLALTAAGLAPAAASATAATAASPGVAVAGVATALGATDALTARLTAAADGTVHVDETLHVTYADPEDYPYLGWDVPTRLPWLDGADDDTTSSLDRQLVTTRLTDPHVTASSAGHDLPLEAATAEAYGGTTRITASPAAGTDRAAVTEVTFHVTYTLTGAVVRTATGPRLYAGVVDGYTSSPPPTTVTATGPGGALDLRCTTLYPYEDGPEPACGAADGGLRTTPGNDGLGVVAAVPGATASAPVLVPASGQVLTDVDLAYVLGSDGSVDVTETIAVRPEDVRPGLSRSVTTREAWSTWKDRVIGVTPLDAVAPDGRPARTSVLPEQGSGDARERKTALVYGQEYRDEAGGAEDDDASTGGAGAEPTWVLHYRLDGLYTADGGTSTFTHDALSDLAYDRVDHATVHVTFPDGTVTARCRTVERWSSDDADGTPCPGTTPGSFTIDHLARDSTILLDVTTPTPLGAAAGPHLVRHVPSALLGFGGLYLGACVVGLVLALVFGLLGRVIHRDRPGSGKRRDPLQAPDVPVVVGGMLDDGVVAERELAAVLLSLAASGNIAFAPEPAGWTLRVLQPQGTRDRYEKLVLRVLTRAATRGGDDRGAARTALVGPALHSVLRTARGTLYEELRRDLAARQADPSTRLFQRRRVQWRAVGPTSWWNTLWALLVPGLFPVVVVVKWLHALGPNGRTGLGHDLADHTAAYRRTLAGKRRRARRDRRGSATTVTVPTGATTTAEYEYRDGDAVPGLVSGSLQYPGTTTGPTLRTAVEPSTVTTATAGAGAVEPLAAYDDPFGTQLPWAVALGVGEAWVRRVEPLVASGALTPLPGLCWGKDGTVVVRWLLTLTRTAKPGVTTADPTDWSGD